MVAGKSLPQQRICGGAFKHLHFVFMMNPTLEVVRSFDYVGRFAPSPTGPLHAGSLVAAMASYLDAKAHRGRWLVRIEDIDEARTLPGAAKAILQSLQKLGIQWDGEVVWQSRRKDLYRAAFAHLGAHTYPCGCTRREIADSRIGLASDGADVYPGICRN